MIVFGDRARSADPRRLLASVGEALAEAEHAPPGVLRHDLLVTALIEAGQLAQGIGDAEMAAVGYDHRSAAQMASMALVLALAGRVGTSWLTGFHAPVAPIDEEEDALARLPLPAAIMVKQPEGYAHYALYPEAYFEVGRGLPADVQVIGLRSIGTSLAGMVAAGAGAPAPLSLRPVGHPFMRTIVVGAELLAELAASPSSRFAVVDEGPGLSGSSLNAVADRLEDAGIEADRLVFVPGHAGSPGQHVAPRHAARWARIDRRVVGFDDLIRPRLAAAVEDLTGPALRPLHDLSGGQWRTLLDWRESEWPPVHAMQERRKFLAESSRGAFLLKFVGLGRTGTSAFARASKLHAAGFTPEPLGVRLGFLVERWEPAVVPLRLATADRSAIVATVGRYLAFRRTLAAEGTAGATLDELAEMTRVNIREALGPEAEAAWQTGYGAIADLPRPLPVETDNRLHAWEWLRGADGRLIKTDAIDHSRAHDLVGCQDIAWDIAGASIEFAMTAGEVERLVAIIEGGGAPLSRPLLRWMVPSYLAFQIGLWSMAVDQAASGERKRIEALLDGYTGALRALLGAGVSPPCSGEGTGRPAARTLARVKLRLAGGRIRGRAGNDEGALVIGRSSLPLETTMADKNLAALFLHQLKDTYFAENTIVKALPKLAGAARSEELRGAFGVHLEETKTQIKRLERVFELIGQKPEGVECKAILGIVAEGDEIIEAFGGSEALDAGLIAAAQAVEHYEIARYGTLLAWSKQLDLGEAETLLQDTLIEEENTDEMLSELAEDDVNAEAAGSA